ncbi:MAG: efflux RND transporter permease subunit [candidate division Zixibacteria bacterium]|nr:efflux RND transporter permease subunit [candidate division Zixibacteria bacterium]MBU1469260.1 efflux RND transporter permease subunit [candidate division Zixibacteria bacterium]
MSEHIDKNKQSRHSPIDRVIKFCLENKLVVLLATLFFIAWGIIVAPFDWNIQAIPRYPVPVDAIPDIGENQQIVFTEWMGRSPQDVEDQISYPLTVSLLGVPGVRTIRSYSFFGFSSIYVIFKDDVEFYWSRSRILEKLNSLPAGTLPDEVQPALGPDATALGQVFWYTLEGRDERGNPTGGWDLHELRSIQDWTVRYALQSADGVAEVASIGGFVQEYQIDANPDAMKSYGVTLSDLFMAVKSSNIDVGARTIEINKVEYVIRGLGFIKELADIENTAVASRDNVPIRIKDVATVSLGPAMRRGALDKGGAEAVGGVVVVRHGANPLATITNVKAKIAEISPGLPKKILGDGSTSQVSIVPFYDRTGLIYETLGTLNTALVDEILVTMIVVILMVMHLRASALISGLLPLTVLMVFIAMKVFKVDANIVALSGIAIAIGTIVDMGIVVSENILRHLEKAQPGADRLQVIFQAASEVGGAVLTAISTTVISFLPVFTMQAAEGKLFKPLAYTKTFALIASVIVAMTIIPPLAHMLFTASESRLKSRRLLPIGLAIGALTLMVWSFWLAGVLLLIMAAYQAFKNHIPERFREKIPTITNYIIVIIIGALLAEHWRPLGYQVGIVGNFVFVALLLGGILFLVQMLIRAYEPILRWCLAHKKQFLVLPLLLLLLGTTIWLGFDSIFGFMPGWIRSTAPYIDVNHAFPGLGKEFMPDLDEGSFLYMPTTMPHASIGEVLDVLQLQDKAFSSIPEIETVVGKLGRVDSPLDPAPISMIETVINYKPEYRVDENGRVLRFKHDEAADEFARDEFGELIPDKNGEPYRQWRDHIKSPDDIWKEIVNAGKITGTTSAPKLQPIATRLVMLQSGMRAPMGVKVKGPDLETIEKVGLEIEKYLKDVPSIESNTVIADRIVGKPYLEIEIDREAIARYGISVRQVQDIIEVAIGGKKLTTTVEGRERYPVRVRYQRELRGTLEDLGDVLIPAPEGVQIPLTQLATMNFVRGPMVIKSEDTFLVGYVIFDKKPDYAEVDVVQDAEEYLSEKIKTGELEIPAGVSYAFAGSYENQVRSEKKLRIVLPLALFLIFMILYFQFRRVSTSLLVFSGIFVAWSGGFLMLWLYGQDWFLNFTILGIDFRELFQVRQLNLSVAVWVGFLALFGVASDDGVIISTYLDQIFARRKPSTVADIREATVAAGKRRVRPALMTVVTTILALLPVLTSTGKGADIMVPMAIPSFGGMTVVIITIFVVPTLYCALAERRLTKSFRKQSLDPATHNDRSNAP